MASLTIYRFFVAFSVLTLVGGLPSSLLATMVLPLNLSQMTKKSDKIFVGRCLESSSELDENNIPSTYVRFEVLKGLKGVGTGESVLIKQFGTQSLPLHVEEGERSLVPFRSFSVAKDVYRPGDEVFLFLYRESVLGFTSPVGAGQGKLVIQGHEAGAKTVVMPPQGNLAGPMDVNQMIQIVEKMVHHGE